MSIDTGNNSGAGIGVKLSLEAVLGQLTQTMGDVVAGLAKLHRFLTPNPIQSPLIRQIRGTVVSDGGAYVFIDLGGPTAGRYWDLRRLSVIRTTLSTGGFSDAFTQVASVIVGLAVTRSPIPNIGAANLVAFDDLITAGTAANNPRIDNWTAHEVTIRFGQRFVVAIKGTTSADQYLATGQAEEYLESTAEIVVA